MLAAIDLNNQHPIAANKIGDVDADGFLADKFKTIEAPIPQCKPKHSFSFGRLTAQTSFRTDR
ncbi:MAG: hypothetical protein JWN71_4858 [Xanthobacteraceae bacterium]|nr:hypothetical protein [Xanthobacteraceae bacterium]